MTFFPSFPQCQRIHTSVHLCRKSRVAIIRAFGWFEDVSMDLASLYFDCRK